MTNDREVLKTESEHRVRELHKFDDRCYKLYLENDKSYAVVARLMGYTTNKIRFAVSRKLQELLDDVTSERDDLKLMLDLVRR